jgi:hypothetical protein
VSRFVPHWHKANKLTEGQTPCSLSPLAANPDNSRILDGWVKDATDMHDYPMTSLRVPELQICFLTDAPAKRADIMQAFLEIQSDDRIKKGDPVPISYAGHGGETDDPAGWPSGDVWPAQMAVSIRCSTHRCSQRLSAAPYRTRRFGPTARFKHSYGKVVHERSPGCLGEFYLTRQVCTTANIQ